MEKLKELISIVTKQKIKSVEILGKSSQETLLNKLYDAIHDQKVSSEEEAIELLYGKNASKKAFYKLKHALKDRLLNTLLLIDAKEKKYSDRNKAYLECHKETMALSYVVNAGIARQTAVYLAKKILHTAVPWRFSEMVISAGRTLRSHHASKSGNRKEYEKYNRLVLDFQELYNAELLVESMYSDIISYYVRDKSTKHFIYDLADQHIRTIDKLNPSIKSARFYYQRAMLKIAKYMSINDYQTTLNLCQQTLDDLDSLDYQDAKAVAAISYQFIACCIQLKQYEAGKKQIDIILSIQEPASFNWFKAYELYLTLCFHTQQYDTASDIYNQISKHRKFKFLPSSIKEVWNIYQAWLYLLYKVKWIDTKYWDDMPASKFRASRFINDMNVFSKDKKGLNIPILVIYILLCLQHKKYDLLIERVEALSKYVDRYIKRSENQRSNYFLRMLLEISKNDFQVSLVKSKTEKYLEQMSRIPIDISGQSHDVEILPYEDSWEIALELIK